MHPSSVGVSIEQVGQEGVAGNMFESRPLFLANIEENPLYTNIFQRVMSPAGSP